MLGASELPLRQGQRVFCSDCLAPGREICYHNPVQNPAAQDGKTRWYHGTREMECSDGFDCGTYRGGRALGTDGRWNTRPGADSGGRSGSGGCSGANEPERPPPSRPVPGLRRRNPAHGALDARNRIPRRARLSALRRATSRLDLGAGTMKSAMSASVGDIPISQPYYTGKEPIYALQF